MNLGQAPVSASVAIIGAGAGGLISAQVLRAHGHRVRVFERQLDVGGTWLYDPLNDAERRAASGRPAYSSLYASLRTNLPTSLMGVPGFDAWDDDDDDDDEDDQPAHLTTAAAATVGAAAAAAAGGGGGGGANAAAAAAAAAADRPSFPGHDGVLRYLRRFAAHHDLKPHIRFGMSVEAVRPVSPPPPPAATAAAAAAAVPVLGCDGSALPRWRVRAVLAQGSPDEQQQQRRQEGEVGAVEEEDFDAVLVCNGHYAQPFTPEVDGAAAFEAAGGVVMHAHDYRAPRAAAFGGKRVLLLGAAASAEDIARELAGVAAAVLVSHASNGPAVARDGPISRCPALARLTGGGEAEFATGERVAVDVVLFATGYRFSFPFLDGATLPPPPPPPPLPEAAGAVAAAGAEAAGGEPLLLRRTRGTVDAAGGAVGAAAEEEEDVAERFVAPLFEQVAHAVLPNLGFIGLPFRVVPFPLFQQQATWFARLLAGTAATALPPLAERLAAHEARLEEMRTAAAGSGGAGAPLRHYHLMGDAQWAYSARLLAESGAPPPDARLPKLRDAVSAAKRSDPLRYRQWRFALEEGGQGFSASPPGPVAAQQ